MLKGSRLSGISGGRNYQLREGTILVHQDAEAAGGAGTFIDDGQVGLAIAIEIPCNQALGIEACQEIDPRGERAVAVAQQDADVAEVQREGTAQMGFRRAVGDHARSSLPSPLKSPTAADASRLPVAKLLAAAKVPLPLPIMTAAMLSP